jgi:penicillin-binding protein 1A
VNALKATEDVRFEEHSGVDIKGLMRVFVKTIILQQDAGGGSTITQQLAKNLFPAREYE